MPVAQATDIFRDLKDRIVHYDLKPKERLTEASLSTQYGSSRTPVREALRKLEQEGWIVLVPHQGYYVRDFSLQEIQEIYEVRIAVERFGARLAAERMTEGQYRGLLEIWGAIRESGSDDQLELLNADETFHESIVSLAGNSELLRLVRSLNERIRIIRRIGLRRRNEMDQLYQDHLLVLNLIRDGRKAEAEDAIEAHIRRSRETIIQLAQEGLARVYLKS